MAATDFKNRYRNEISNAQLRNNLSKATLQAVDKRLESFKELDFESFRNDARRIKDEAIGHLNEYLSHFEDAASKNGCNLFYAETPDRVKEYILDLAKRHGVKSIVKSKSMVTEEIELVQYLEEHGIETVETDLGEYIVQLAGEKPSHITTPAIHKSRNEIAALFHEKLGTALNNDPAFLTAEARTVLREKFLSAGMGISGANFLVADTGDIVIVENEGNARLSTSSPAIHVVVAGIEKVIPRFADLRIFMRLLARSSTGQKLTSYVSLIRGPQKQDEKDGPAEVHIILLDNGRTKLLGGEYRDVLNCIRCGACLNVCPVYRTIGGHAYGSVYPGPIGSLVTPLYFGIENARELPFASSLCGNCTQVCPVGIDIHHHLLTLRSEIVTRSSPFLERMMFRYFKSMMLRPRRFNLIGRIGRFLSEKKLFRGIAGGWTRFRELPESPGHSFREVFKTRENS
ncbi:MAG TPA: LutB/LldF family L-lactate oxidation iron-sulfur protein [Candidatus Kryptonia bacterium]